MIRQLRRLTRPLPALGPGVAAIAVYSEATPQGMRLRLAAETGFEGVACFDDAARLACLYVALWQRHHVSWARPAALEMLGFVRAMQMPDGWFANFISDWDGTKNLVAPTSADPQGPWLARACHALAAAASAFGDDQCGRAYERALPWLDLPTPHVDVRAVALLAALHYHHATGSGEDARRATRLATEIFQSRQAGILPDVSGSEEVHLWGHLQECALAEAGKVFRCAEWVQAARESADRLLAPAARLAFPAARTIPFDVSATVQGLEAVGVAGGGDHYLRLAKLARGWFAGRNAASTPVFDRRRGTVHDGIDDGRVSANSGAEANIEGGLALAGPPMLAGSGGS